MSEDGPAVKKAKPSGIKRRAVGSGPKGKDKARYMLKYHGYYF
jgi:hypothetical protein